MDQNPALTQNPMVTVGLLNMVNVVSPTGAFVFAIKQLIRSLLHNVRVGARDFKDAVSVLEKVFDATGL